MSMLVICMVVSRPSGKPTKMSIDIIHLELGSVAVSEALIIGSEEI